MTITFENLHRDIDCNCICLNTKEDCTSIFLRLIKGNDLTINDLQSYCEEGKSLRRNNADCDYICKSRGLSVTIYQPDAEERFVQKFTESKNFFRPLESRVIAYCKLRFKKGAGKVKPTPSRTDCYHHTFFKSDNFSIASIEVLEIVSMNADV